MLEVSWPDSSVFTRTLRPGEMNTVVEVLHPSGAELTPLANDTQVLGQQTVKAKQLSQNFVFMDNMEIKIVCEQVGSGKLFSVLSTFLVNPSSLYVFQCGEGFVVKDGRCVGTAFHFCSFAHK